MRPSDAKRVLSNVMSEERSGTLRAQPSRLRYLNANEITALTGTVLPAPKLLGPVNPV